jgi:ubiquinone/menaquinone biosynthesis C-methylase UbiE
MNNTEFDKFADEYSALHKTAIASFGEEPAYFSEYKMRDFNHLIDTLLPTAVSGRYLDFGAGTGSAVPFFRKYLPRAHLTCSDVSAKSLTVAENKYGTVAEYISFSGQELPFPDNFFDGAYSSCVFHHILPEQHLLWLRELCRVLKPGGLLMIYEHNPLNPVTVRTVRICPFDKNAILIRATTMKNRILQAGFNISKSRYRVFFPKNFSIMRPLEDCLSWLPMGAQYYVYAIK